MTAPLLLSRNEIDDVRWNETVKNSEQHIIYAYSWYLDVVCEQWMALVWPAAEDYQVIMPLPVKKKWFIEVIQQPLFCQYLGIFSSRDLSKSVVEEFLKSLDRNFRYISTYNFNPSNTANLRPLIRRFNTFRLSENTTFLLSLRSCYENLSAGYSLDRKTNLKRSFKENWSFEKSQDFKPLVEMFQQNHESKIAGGVRKSTYEILSQLLEQISENQSLEIWYAIKDDLLHSGVLIVKSENKAIYLFNAADKIGRKGNARTIMLDKFFQENADSSILFDFESPDVESIASFYRSFGATAANYFGIKKNDLFFPFKQIQNRRLKKMLNTRPTLSEDF
ncbi:hypothetical protein SAMN04487995_1900 [Dyadobacter koreensis]|uniref:Acetyltransferase (GNAT) domain-containing protein n=1 Tax=Dyadobacter koreensis TaxID=408657 RepID=A0A1H6T8W4_9BACT|nr:hypothetical protein [Dyadobacter koreensis]SEI72730.1 hypothetical protein SAMN04487995_1900 [Dyadobacter koreensis]